MVRFRVLGSLEIDVDGVAAELGGARQRAVLAVLLMHANEPVATDRLVSESWGESAPATATKTAQVYVSRLRGALGNDTLTTTTGGYLLRVPPGALDTDELEELRARAREADPREAARLLRQGLALWRGAPYADLRYEEALQPEIRRLEELRLATLEERVEADLAAGETSELVAELESLVGEHPHRERLRGFLMLALYRSGRQAEALETYRQGRQLLDTELGLEPGPELRELERAILAHDPALEGPRRAIRRTARRRSGVLLAAGGVLLLAAALTAVVFVRDRDDESSSRGAGAEALDAQTGKLLASVPLGTSPSSVAVGAGAVWVLDADDKTISVIDPGTRSLESVFSTSSTPTDLAVGAGAVWIGNAFRELPFSSQSLPESVSRLDPDSHVVVTTIPLPRTSVIQYIRLGGLDQQQHIAVTRDAVWVISPDLSVSRIDPRTNTLVGRVRGVKATSIAAGSGGVWVIDERGVARIDPRTNTITQRIDVPAAGLTTLAVGAHTIWAADPFGGSVWRIDLGPEPLQRTITLDVGANWVAVGAGAVWATNEIAGLVYRIDPSTNEAQIVNRTDAPAAVAVGAGTAWVSAGGQPSSGTALPTSVCSQVFSGGVANPRFLIVSDFPLKGSDIANTHQMVEAIRLVLERRGYRAGAYTIGYQSCDDSTAQTGGFDAARCYTNAKAYARNPDVIGIVGAYNSPCSRQAIPVANQAADGPLAMISPSNTGTELTRLVPGENTPPDLQHLYPTGERNYVRIHPPTHLTAAPLARFAKEKGVKRLFLSWEGDNHYWAAFAANVRNAAEHFGLQIAGAAPFDPEAGNYRQLARQIASTRADGVMLAAHVPPSIHSLLRDLRSGLGPRVTLIGSEGFLGNLFAAAGPAALGMYVAYPGADVEVLPPAGKRFLEDLEARTGKPSRFYTASAAQSAEILLDAIARSDGTRSSVTKQLFKTEVRNGILGDIRFDKNGDLVEAPVTIFRVVRPSRAPNGLAVDRVVIARTAVLR